MKGRRKRAKANGVGFTSGASRYDGIIIDEVGREFGAVEVSSTNDGYSEKVQRDEQKLLVVLHDMLVELQRHARDKHLEVKGLKVVGILNFGKEVTYYYTALANRQKGTVAKCLL